MKSTSLMELLCRRKLLTVLSLLTWQTIVVTHGSAVPAPQDLSFNSYNLRNELIWKPGNGAGNGTRYTVQYAIYGDGEKNKAKVVWRPMKKCREVLQTSCDLSYETSDLEEEYYGRVRAISPEGASKWKTTRRFMPKRQTTFGPPIVKVMLKERKMTIKLKGPMRWKADNRTKEQSLAKYYPQMMYNVSIHNSKTKKTMSFLLQNNSMEYGRLNYSTEFCVSAKVLILSSIFQTHASQDECVTTARDPFFDHILLVILGYILPIALTLFFLIITGCIVYRYIFGNKQKMPSNLWVQHQSDPKVLIVNLISVQKPGFVVQHGESNSPAEPLLSILENEEKPLIQRVATYATQTHAPELRPQQVPLEDDIQVQAEHNHLPARASRNSSVDYGIVVRASSQGESEAEGEDGPEGHTGSDVSWSVVGSRAQTSKQPVQGDCPRRLTYRGQLQDILTSGHEEAEAPSLLEDSNEGIPVVHRVVSYATQRHAPALPPQPVPSKDDSEVEEEQNHSPAWASRNSSVDYGRITRASSQDEEEEEEEEGEDWSEGHTGGDMSSSVVGNVAQTGEQPVCSDCTQPSAYRGQFQNILTCGYEEAEEDAVEDIETNESILVDWDPNTGKLQIPNLSLLQIEPNLVEEEKPECDQVQPANLLPNVYLRQSSEESTESVDALTKIENNWALQIHM
ncbi:hypothetical protein GJAV_G00118760 [Gymnothorax javanicus]|nr:hypothetical protein GJAV_G00118760 [Gymnothorax javanicus]